MTPFNVALLCATVGTVTSFTTYVVAHRARRRRHLDRIGTRIATHARMSMFLHPSYDVEHGRADDWSAWENELEEADS